VRVGLCLGVPSSVLFDGLISALRFALHANPIIDMLLLLLGANFSLSYRVIGARTEIGNDITWLKLLGWVCYPLIHEVVPMESMKALRQCVTPIIQDVDADPTVLLDALTVIIRFIEDDGCEASVSRQKCLVNTSGIEVHLIRLLHHSSERIQLCALKLLTRSLQLIPGLIHTCLREHRINFENFAHFCSESMVGESQKEIRSIVHLLTHQSTILDSYDDFLPLLVLILRSTCDGVALMSAQSDCLTLISRCVDEVGRPAEQWLLQHDLVPLLIASIRLSSLSSGADHSRDHNLTIYEILRALMWSHLDHHADDGATLHPWMVQLVDSPRGRKGIERTHQHRDKACMQTRLMMDRRVRYGACVMLAIN
jgi:hypothetical protein